MVGGCMKDLKNVKIWGMGACLGNTVYEFELHWIVVETVLLFLNYLNLLLLQGSMTMKSVDLLCTSL